MSKQRRGGLGRGIGALIPTAPPSGAIGPATISVPARDSGVATIPRGETLPGATVPRSETVPPADVETGVAGSQDSIANATIDPGSLTPAGTEHARVPVAESTEVPESIEMESDLVPVPGATFAEIPIDAIRANASQPRQVFDPDALAELTHSIKEFGVLQPIVVRDDGQNGYELVMGERRLRASQAAGLTEIPAIIRSTADDAMLRDALLENIHRAGLNPLEEAAAYKQLLEDFGVTHEELARRIGRSRSQVSNTIRLLNLSVPVQRRVAAGVLSAGHARALLALIDSEQQDELAARIVAEGLSVRATEELVTLAARQVPTAKRRGPSQRITAPGVTDLADRLSDAFDTRVRVELGKRKGKITVEFGSIDDLERIVAMMAPTVSSS